MLTNNISFSRCFIKRIRKDIQLKNKRSYNKLVSVDNTTNNNNNKLNLLPEDIVLELGKHIVGQEEAKKAVAIALRNRWRRQKIKEPMRSEISPMNILMSGPTGSGKTEISRRLAKLTDSPFLKVEATKFTEIGIYGSNAESMIKDLVNVAVEMEREKAMKESMEIARDKAIDRIVRLLLKNNSESGHIVKETLKKQVKSGEADHHLIEVSFKPNSQNFRGKTNGEMDEMMQNLNRMVGTVISSPIFKRKEEQANEKEKITVKDALPRLQQEESANIIDEKIIVKNAVEKVQQNGIIFIDEIDKLVSNNDQFKTSYKKGEGVQKELLALTEGCAINTNYGIVYTDHILFIASGAFHRCRPSDLMPELQGRLPIRVNLSPLGEKEFIKILKETEFNLLDQAIELMKTENVKLNFTQDGIEEIASISAKVNHQTDDIGARRLATVVSKITEDVSFYAPRLQGSKHIIDRVYVKSKLGGILDKADLTKYIL